MPAGYGDPLSRGAPRYDNEALRRITALAERLKTERQETLTAGEMEAIGEEVGLDPSFIQQAIAQFHAAPPAFAKPTKEEPRAIAPVADLEHEASPVPAYLL